LLENIHPDAVEAFQNEGFDVETTKGALSEVELLERIEGVTVLGIRSKTKVTDKVLSAADQLMAVGAFCIGTDQIDLASATMNGVTVFNAPFSNTRSVVELATAEIISMARRLAEKNEQLHAGIWNKSADGAHEVRGRTLGIVGYGNIGSQLSVVAESLGLRVIFYDTSDKLALGNAQRCSTLEEVLKTADIVSLHVDGRPSNNSMFGDRQFSQMKPGALFLNLCRGFVIDHDALRRHLDSGHLAGAAIDVFPEEPSGKSEEFKSVLRGVPNVILTPHIGGSTEEAQSDIGHFVSRKLIDFVAEGSTSLSVNMPRVVPSDREGVCRIAHLHRNVPGVMAKINTVLAEADVNVEAQFLGTQGELGYALTDLAVPCSDELVKGLQALDATVRLRILS
jgi:D-3-phosphoglycerate dehydrogenase / 2-oxoglutarate reductase